jgi:ABC-type polysaccharide/polyol phosphate export permease
LTAAIREIIDAFGRWRLWTALANDDISNVFRRTYLGGFWFALSFAVLLGAKLVVFGAMSPRSMAHFAIYMAIGLIVWELLAGILSEGCTVFTGAANYIAGMKLPLPLFSMRSLTRQLIQAAYKVIPLAGLIAWFQPPLGWVALSAIPAVLFIVATGFAVQLTVGVICLRFRDVQQLISSAVKVLFFLSPILWTPEQLAAVFKYLWWNPFYHFIEIVRAPILDNVLPVESWYFCLAVFMFIVPTALLTYSGTRRQIPFWV